MSTNRTALSPRPVGSREAPLFVIATEGKHTERQYFEGLKQHYNNTNIHIEILATEEGKSSPEFVCDRLENRYQFVQGDEFWLVLDVDCWGDEKLNEVCRAAITRGYQTAVSNPCFEFWLYLHFSEPDLSDQKWDALLKDKNGIHSKAMKARLKDCLVTNTGRGYHEARLKSERFYPHISDAVSRARTVDTNIEEIWPATFPGTHVYRLAERLLAFLAPSDTSELGRR